jgi:hypothetical protein
MEKKWISYQQNNGAIITSLMYSKNGKPTDKLLGIVILKETITTNIEFWYY